MLNDDLNKKIGSILGTIKTRQKEEKFSKNFDKNNDDYGELLENVAKKFAKHMVESQVELPPIDTPSDKEYPMNIHEPSVYNVEPPTVEPQKGNDGDEDLIKKLTEQNILLVELIKQIMESIKKEKSKKIKFNRDEKGNIASAELIVTDINNNIEKKEMSIEEIENNLDMDGNFIH